MHIYIYIHNFVAYFKLYIYIYTCRFYLYLFYRITYAFGICGSTKFVVSGDSQVICSWRAHPLTTQDLLLCDSTQNWKDASRMLFWNQMEGWGIFLKCQQSVFLSNPMECKPNSGDITGCETWYVPTCRRTWSTSQCQPSSWKARQFWKPDNKFKKLPQKILEILESFLSDFKCHVVLKNWACHHQTASALWAHHCFWQASPGAQMSGTRLSPQRWSSRDYVSKISFSHSHDHVGCFQKTELEGFTAAFFPRQWQGLMFQTFIGDHIHRHCGHVYIFMCTKTIGMMTKVQIVMQPNVHFFN